jgi:hypothetical protein
VDEVRIEPCTFWPVIDPSLYCVLFCLPSSLFSLLIDPFTWVLWDSGEDNRYPYGSDMGYHIWKTSDHPVLRPEDGQLKIGMTVKKGSTLQLHFLLFFFFLPSSHDF